MSNRKMVRKHIDFVMARNIWNGFEGKLIAILIKELNFEMDKGMIPFGASFFNITELEGTMGVKLNSTRVKEACRNLIKKHCEIQITNEKGKKVWEFISVFDTLRYTEEESYVVCKFNDSMMPYIREIKKNYVTYDITNILHFRSKYSISIYELCKNDTRFKREKYVNKILDLDFMHTWLQTPKIYKERFSDFKKYVLETVADDLTTLSDVAFSYKEIKQGRKVVKIELKYTKNLLKKENRLDYAKLLKEARKHKTDEKKLRAINVKIKALYSKEKLDKNINLSGAYKKIN